MAEWYTRHRKCETHFYHSFNSYAFPSFFVRRCLWFIDDVRARVVPGISINIAEKQKCQRRIYVCSCLQFAHYARYSSHNKFHASSIFIVYHYTMIFFDCAYVRDYACPTESVLKVRHVSVGCVSAMRLNRLLGPFFVCVKWASKGIV